MTPDERPDLVATFEHYGVDINGAGRQMVKCPVHDEGNPSCSIDIERGLWHCFACGAGGSAWDLIMSKEGVDYHGAREFVASTGIPTGGAGGSGVSLPGIHHAGRRRSAAGARDRPRGGGFRPSWRGR